MTPKEKAKELVKKYKYYLDIELNNSGNKEQAKLYALIAVGELIDEQTSWQNGQVNPVLYWQEVKQEIKKL